MTADDITQRVRALLPEISARSAAFEAERRLPADMIDKLKAAGCFRIQTLRAFGGAELDLRACLAMIEMVASADGSTGWLVSIGSETPAILSRCSAGAFKAFYENGPDLIAAGGAAPTGAAEIVESGYRVSGRWAWASGSHHADVIIAACVVRENGVARPGAMPGQPQTRIVVVPRAAVEIIDTWQVSGLRATGSNDFTIKDVFVPHSLTLDLLAGEPSIPNDIYRGAMAQGALHLAAVGIGIAQGALDDIVAFGRANKERVASSSRAAEAPLLQFRLGEADLRLRAARALLYAQAETFVRGVASLPLGAAQLAHPLTKTSVATASYVANEAARVTDVAYHAGGGTAMRDKSPLQRRLRDAHAVTQHMILSGAAIARHGAWVAEG